MKRTAALVVLLFTAAAIAPAQTAEHRPSMLGRSPLPDVVSIHSGRFVTSDIDDLLVVQDLGSLRLPSRPGSGKARAGICRVALLRFEADEFRAVWQSPPLLGFTTPDAGLAGHAWTSGDIDSDGLSELLLFTADSCRVVHFGPDSIHDETFDLSGAWVTAAVACDIDGDSSTEIITLELSPVDSLLTTRLLRVYRATDSGLDPVSEYLAGIDWGAGMTVNLLGSSRLEDYPDELPVLTAVYTELRPSIYAALYQSGPDSFALTTNPFPWQEWFTKKQVLPAGKLTLFNVGDTLVGYGYFVPGSRPAGPSKSFAALQDGEWRLLPVTDQAQRLCGPVCRYTSGNVSGWLELRDDIFRFYPGDVFDWD